MADERTGPRRPSPHLTWAELACRDGTPYPPAWRTTRLPPLAAAFEAIRTACGNRPIRVLSAYRTPEHNRRIGGARQSQHVEGRALDLRPPAGMTVAAFVETIRRCAQTTAPQIRGLGRYRTFVHIDTRPSLRLVVWDGHDARKDNT